MLMCPWLLVLDVQACTCTCRSHLTAKTDVYVCRRSAVALKGTGALAVANESAFTPASPAILLRLDHLVHLNFVGWSTELS